MKKLLGITAIATGLLLASSAASATAFSGGDVNLVGSAGILNDGTLQLTNALGQAGAAWSNTAWSTTNSFNTNFNFSLQGSAAYPQQADGIAFVMQGLGTSAIGATGGNIGVGGLSPSVAAGIQTWYNNTVGFSNNGNPYSAKSAGFNLGAASSITGAEDVAYNASTHLLTMTVQVNADGKSASFSDSENVNLQSVFGNTMTVGFTGGTGGSMSTQSISNWSVSAVPEPQTYALMGLGMLALVFARRRNML